MFKETELTCNECTSCKQPADDVQFQPDGIFVKQMLIEDQFTLIPQHAHTYDHLSMLAAGSVRVWKNGVQDEDYAAPAGIFIGAGIKHTFQALEANTIIYCVHRLRGEKVEIAAEHQFEGVV